MKERILRQLEDLENERGIRVLYACESGSRAWGFASHDSDYDARFIFAYPRSRYLAIDEPADTIDLEVDADGMDLTGWDLRKALRLFQKSNGSLNEWLFSPIVYREEDSVMGEWRDLLVDYFSPSAAAGHYVGLCKKFWLGRLQEESVTAKQYLYCLRALFAARWIEEKRERAPILFSELRAGIDVNKEIDDAIDAMIEAKAQEREKDVMARHEVLHDHIGTALPESDERVARIPETQSNDATALDRFFRSVVE